MEMVRMSSDLRLKKDVELSQAAYLKFHPVFNILVSSVLNVIYHGFFILSSRFACIKSDANHLLTSFLVSIVYIGIVPETLQLSILSILRLPGIARQPEK